MTMTYEDELVYLRARARLRQLMAEHQLTQERLGEVLGLPQSRISERLSGRSRLTLPELCRLSSHFGVPIDDFVADPVRTHDPGLLPSRFEQLRWSEPLSASLKLALRVA